jgi:hypothetical protein
MRTKTRIILSLAVAAILILSEVCISELFPASMAAIATTPLIILWSLGSAGAVFAILKMVHSKVLAGMLIVVIIVAGIFLQLWIHPVAEDSNTFTQIRNYWLVYRDFPAKIQYEQLILGNEPEKIAAIVKNKETLPDKILVFAIKYAGGNNQENHYFIELRGDKLVYDSNKLQITEKDGITTLTVYPDTNLSRHYAIKRKIKDLFTLYQISGQRISGDDVVYYASDFKVQSGAHKIFALLLSWKK